jgi:nucleoid-associated protein YgaU
MQTIAKAVLGSSNKWQAIAKANPTVDPTRMKIGTKLVIPAGGATAASEPTLASGGSSSNASNKTASSAGRTTGGTSSTTATASAAGGTHTVAKGETLSSIAKKYYGDSKLWKLIANANPKVNPNSISVGDKLSIPAKSAVVSGGNVER